MEQTIYSKYSNERAEQFCIRTDIVMTEDGKKMVYKHPLRTSGREHIRQIGQAFAELQKAYQSQAIQICDCEVEGVSVRFPFVEGRTLQDEMEQALKRADIISAENIIREYIRRIREDGGNDSFRISPQFKEVFGEAQPGEELSCAAVSDVDMIFSNILVSDGEAWAKDTKWTVIDYEWTFHFLIPKAFILYRALYFAYYQILYKSDWNLRDLMQMADITEQQARIFARMEEHFQEYLGKGSLPVRNMQRRMGTKIRKLEQTEGQSIPMPALGGEIMPESAWIKVRKLQYHIDRQEYQDGSVICSGWAVAKAKDGRYLPVNIYLTDADGQIIPAEVTRVKRRDVAEVLRIDNVTNPIWGFDCVWIAPPAEGWKIHFLLGNCEKVYEAGSLIRG